MTLGERHDVAIVGGGFSGAVLAARLAVDRSGPPLKILLIDRTGRFGRGVAYGTTNPRHLLNVPAGQMSAYAEAPNDFFNWAKLRVHGIDASSFIGRSLYGDYVASVLDDAIRKRAPRTAVEERVASARRIEAADKTGLHRIHLEDGDVSARLVVLATGNAPPQPLGIPGFGEGADPRLVTDPWAARALEPLIGSGKILIVGTGLTMIDIVLELVGRGHRGEIIAVSRRGLLPQPHHSQTPTATKLLDESALSGKAGAHRLVRVVTTAVLRALKAEGDWRSVVSEIRPHTARIWRELGEKGQASFLRHVGPYWETHRHRAPPAVDDALLGLLASGQLQLRAGRVGAVRASANGFSIGFEPRDGGDAEVFEVAGVVNCAGPDGDVRRSRDPLMASMLATGLITPGPQSLGIDVDDSGAVIGTDGAPSSFLFAIGPLRRGRLFETTAVPEIRVQAADMVRRLREQA